ncbi:ribose-5-phosphate isomerase RpiA [Halorhabdus sp. CUG00001]|uniref:ribose-5-phosphate isomerase RpiA n=1 Tax=Halorhabdus sp. CUG00001 TaxID=2600297 RepID=UPI00131EB416|nr:ribose-5-phosphate isomerase RpiA [Halorhabdus sp. CUG00001]
MDESTRKAAKRRASERAVEAVTDGDMVGLGSGSTAEHAIRLLGDKVEDGLDIVGVPTSFQAREVATDVGIELTTLEETAGRLDVAIDGADQFAGGDLIKGGGAAHAREKIVDSAAQELVIVVDPTKRADVLDAAVPVEILPDARRTAADAIRALDGEPTLRRAKHKSGPVVTDNGNLVFDCDFGELTDPATLASALSELPGVVEHGLFLDLADVVYLGTETGVERIEP